MTTLSASILVFGTSAAVLVIEILAGRLLAPYVGVSIVTFTGIIGTVLAGIATGNAVGGRISDNRDPRRLLGPTIVVGGVLTWLALPVISLLGPEAGEGPMAILALAATAFFLPAAFLSAVTPMAAKLRLDDLGETGSVVGGLSAAGTAGALFGTFVTGFFLVTALASQPIVIGVGAALVVAGVALWVRLGSGRPHPLVIVGILAAGALAVLSDGPCEHETAYFCARVEADEARPTGRILWLDQLRHSYVDLDDPTHLEFRYVRLLADVAASIDSGPIDALHLGGGGFSFPRYLAAVRPGTTSRVLEIDEELVRIAEAELGLVQGPELEVDVGDARLALDELETDGYDLIVGDAFASLSVPWHLTTVEVAAEIERILRPGGIYAMNVIDGDRSRFARAELATLAEHFDHVAIILPADGVPDDRRVNQIIVASDRPIPELDIDPADGRLLVGDGVWEYVDGERVLTDDFAPVDQLLELG